jgi:hypothetical protein
MTRATVEDAVSRACDAVLAVEAMTAQHDLSRMTAGVAGAQPMSVLSPVERRGESEGCPLSNPLLLFPPRSGEHKPGANH